MSVKIPDLKEMLEVGMHLGHKKERSHPRAKEFIFGLRDKINIINLELTQEKLKDVLTYLENETKKGRTFLFVGTKQQAKEIVKDAATKCEMPYIIERWLGGTLTNYENIRKGIKRLIEIQTILSSPDEDVSKKEKVSLKKEQEKLEKFYGGLTKLSSKPDALIVLDTASEHNAVTEANKESISVIGICDTDADPTILSKYIPANDDARGSIQLIMNLITEAILSAKKGKDKEIEAKNESGDMENAELK